MTLQLCFNTGCWAVLTGFCAGWKKGRFVTGFSLGGCRVQRAFRKRKKTFLSRSLHNVKMVRTLSSLIKLKMKNCGFDWASAVSRLMLNSVSLWVGIILFGTFKSRRCQNWRSWKPCVAFISSFQSFFQSKCNIFHILKCDLLLLTIRENRLAFYDAVIVMLVEHVKCEDEK